MTLPLQFDNLNHAPLRRGDARPHRQPVGVGALGSVTSFTARPVRLSESVYRRRRIVAAACGVLVLSLGMYLVRSINATGDLLLPRVPVSAQEVPGSTEPDAAGTLRGQPLQRGGTYVAQRGDTLWIVARALKPQGDLSGLIRQLIRANGGPSLEVGQVVRLPA